jgi:Family of unknown function (DUF6178)
MTKQAVEIFEPRRLLNRILDTPHLAQIVPSLEPAVLHQLVRHCGLEDSGEILALATTEQLVRVFDDDLWRSDAAGDEDQFDADRFGLWLEVLADVGVATAAEKIAGMDADFLTAALSRHVLVLDQETLIFGEAVTENGPDDYDPLENARAVLAENTLEAGQSHDLGGFTVIARRKASWDALLGILIHIEAKEPRLFGTLMKRCSHLSTEYIVDNGGLHEVLTSDAQVMADIAGEREQRREQEGYVSSSQAVAFLKRARKYHGGPRAAPSSDPVTMAYFRELKQRSMSRGADEAMASRGDEPLARAPEPEVAAFLATLQDGGVLPRPQPPLLPKGAATAEDRLSLIRAELQVTMERDGAVYSRRTEELAYLANVLIAGCSFASRRFQAVEAADAVLATCNLGLQNWPVAAGAGLPAAFLMDHDLVAVFRRGWSVLYEEVGVYVASRLMEILSELRCDDHEVQHQLRDLHRALKAQVKAGTPWRARDELDVIAILDQPSWQTLLGLVDECPVVPKVAEATREGRPPLRVSSEFEFISENRQIAWVRDFLTALPERLLER